MSSADSSVEQNENTIWQHLDYYVRRLEGELVLVQTLLKQMSDRSLDNAEIGTFYIALDDLDAEWAEAVLEQGEHLEEGKSCDFVPPDEVMLYLEDDEDNL